MATMRSGFLTGSGGSGEVLGASGCRVRQLGRQRRGASGGESCGSCGGDDNGREGCEECEDREHQGAPGDRQPRKPHRGGGPHGRWVGVPIRGPQRRVHGDLRSAGAS